MKSSVVCLAFATLAFFPLARAQGQPSLSFPQGLYYSPAERDGELSARFPIVLRTDVDYGLADIRPVIIHAMANGASDHAVFDAAKLDLLPAAATFGPTIYLRISKNAPRARNYQVQVNFMRPVSKPANSQDPKPTEILVQTVTFTLGGGAPKLAVPSALEIRVTQPFTKEPIAHGALSVRESTNLGPLTQIAISDISVRARADQNGRLKDASVSVIAAGQRADLPLVVERHFPLGPTTGTLQVNARELTEPLSIPYTIIVHRPYFWIYIVSAAGFGLGYLFRVVLKSWRQILAARRAARELDETITGDLAVPDVTLQAALRTIQDELRAAERGRNLAKIQLATTEAAAKRQTALGDFTERQKVLARRIDEFEAAVVQQWNFPPLAAALRQYLDRIAAVTRLQAQGDIAGATKELEATIENGGVALIVEIDRWLNGAASSLDALTGSLPHVAAADQAATDASSTEWKAQHPASKIPPTTAAPRDIQTALQKAHHGWGMLHSLLGAIRDAAIKRALLDAQAVRQAGGKALPALVEPTAAFLDAVKAELAKPVPAPAEITAKYAEFCREWDEALRPALANPANQAAVTEAALGGNWAAALSAAGSKSDEATIATASLLGGPAAKPSRVDARFSVTTPSAPAAGIRTFAVIRSHPAAPSLDQIIAAERWAGWAQTLAATGIFLVGMYFANQATWTGTAAEFFKLFLAAFTADFAADALVNAVKK